MSSGDYSGQIMTEMLCLSLQTSISLVLSLNMIQSFFLSQKTYYAESITAQMSSVFCGSG